MNASKLLTCLTLVVLFQGLAACSSQPAFIRSPGLSPAQLLDGTQFGVSAGEGPPAVDLIAVNDDMRVFLEEHVPTGVSDRRKVELILGAILRDGLRLTYDNFKTLTAEETFYAREGNCLSFTNLFVALAREAGVDVEYQAVEVPATWSEQGGRWLFNLHINVLVDLPGRVQVVDFSLEDYRSDYPSERIDDREVLARYHNNLGVHWMNEGDHGLAFMQLRRALELEPGLGFVWTNLGTLYRHQGNNDAAEAAFLHAVDLSDELVANSNLARLYAATGDVQRADYYRDRVRRFRHQNPYYLFYLAQEAYGREDYVKAESLLKQAIHRESREHDFHNLLGLVYTQEREWKNAERSFTRAAALGTGEAQARYGRKLELLAGRE